jgi:TetR/AcrR family transcriptional repressor of mexJK operon
MLSVRTTAVGKEIHIRDAALRRRMLAVAKHRFARFGYDGVSLDDIARSADVSRAELLLSFDDKRGLLTAILEDGWESINPRLADIAVNSVTARAAVLAMLALMMKLMQSDEDLVRLLLFEGRRPDPESSEVSFSRGYRRFMQVCVDVVAHGQRDGSFRPSLHPQVTASILIGAIEGVMRDRLVAEQESSITPYTGIYLMSGFDALVSSLKARVRQGTQPPRGNGAEQNKLTPASSTKLVQTPPR